MGVWLVMEAMTVAATSRSLMFREVEACLRISMAASWLHLFWAMIAPTAMEIVVRDFMAFAMSFFASCV